MRTWGFLLSVQALRLPRQLPHIAGVAGYVYVVQSRLNLVHHAEGRRMNLQNRKIQRDRHECLFPAGKARYTYLTDQRNDVETAKEELEGIIEDITGEMTRIFAEQFHLLSESFQATFTFFRRSIPTNAPGTPGLSIPEPPRPPRDG